ncbi:MAG: RluA family pseudouridine synthase, partial [Cetobacterium sp.]
DSVDGFSLVEVGIETGRTHQIRVHMKSLNHPILGDETYGNSSELAKRQMLHSYYLKFLHPITGIETVILGPLKDDFKNVAKRLKLDLTKIVRMYK